MDTDDATMPTDEAPKKGRRKGEHVPFSFAAPALKRTGLTVKEFCKRAGVSDAQWYVWRKKGTCPIWFRAAVNGLMAELALGPVKNGRLPVARAPVGRDVIEANHAQRQERDYKVIGVAVPEGHEAVVRALLASLNYPVR